MVSFKKLAVVAALGALATSSAAFAQDSMNIPADQMIKEMATEAAAEGAHMVHGEHVTTVKPMDENSAVVVDSVTGIVKGPDGSDHVVHDIKKTTLQRSTDRYGNVSVRADSIEGYSLTNAQPVACPSGTTAQADGTCLITGNYMGGNY